MSASARPRLLVSTSTFPRWVGDTEPSFVYELARRLTDRFEVHVLAPHSAGAKQAECMEGLSVHRYRYAPVQFERLAYQGGLVANLRRNPILYGLIPSFFIAQAVALRRLTTRHDFSVIHAHWLVPQGLIGLMGMRRRPRTPMLVTSHGGDLFGLRQPGMAAVKRLVLQRSDAVTVVSDAMKSEVHRIAPATKVRVVPMGVDLVGRFIPPARASGRRDSTVLFVGRLVEKKGVDVLLRALAKVLGEGLRAHLIVVGDGPNRLPLEKLADGLGISGAVQFMGALPPSDLPRLYQDAKVTVVPSIVASDGDTEGLGLVTIEAMGCGCPVIVSDLPAIRDVAASGANARVVAPGNVGHLASALMAVLKNSREAERMAEVARRRVVERYDWEVISRRYGEILESLLVGEPCDAIERNR